jgi:hypothetical protein
MNDMSGNLPSKGPLRQSSVSGLLEAVWLPAALRAVTVQTAVPCERPYPISAPDLTRDHELFTFVGAGAGGGVLKTLVLNRYRLRYRSDIESESAKKET